MKNIATTPEIDNLLATNAPVALGVSGGKGSCALGLAIPRHLEKIGHSGPKLFVHSDLGRVRAAVASAVGLEVSYDHPAEIVGRYEELMAAKAA